MFNRPRFRWLLLLCTLAVTASDGLAQSTRKKVDGWEAVWETLQKPTPEDVPADAHREGPPIAQGNRALFRFRAPKEAARVFLAGSFNGWALNQNGAVTNPRFAMKPTPEGVWWTLEKLSPSVAEYKFVVQYPSGKFEWFTDPNVPKVAQSGNTSFDFATIASTEPATNGAPTQNLRPLKPVELVQSQTPQLAVTSEKVWVRPDQENALNVTLDKKLDLKEARFQIQIETPLGSPINTFSFPCNAGENRLVIPPLKQEGGFLARVRLQSGKRTLREGKAVLSVVENVADDLRYGFYATYNALGQNYSTKADMLARLHLNALEFYDYFPAHGYYAPREAQYKFEPFGTSINALDIQRKIEAGHARNILSVAYVAAYAASESVYRQHPYAMTDEKGVPKIFNGGIMTEAEADLQKKPKWFWIMNVANDSPWHQYILSEFARTLDDSPKDLVSFDGFEIDTYGDSPDTKFYAPSSKRNGDLLSDVLHDFVGDVQSLTHKIKPNGVVSFNSVNEFGVENMGDVTDFLFLEIWRGHTDNLESLVDICTRNRASHSQRVVLKMYPADMNPKQTSWPTNTLRRVLGATMTGGGTLMVAGEPDEKNAQMHALNTLYYPDHQPASPANYKVLKDYYAYDALLYGYTHGRGVKNTALENPVEGCITRTYAVPDKHALVVQLLNVGSEMRWSVDANGPTLINKEISLELPANVAPKEVYYATPDSPKLQTPAKLDFNVSDGHLRVLIPELKVHGTLILKY